jgi:cell division protein ZapD
MMLFEFPLHERTRLFLRLENTFTRFRQLASVQEKATDHAALGVLFELLEIVAVRSDLKSELSQEIEKQRSALAQYQGVSGVDADALLHVLTELDAAYNALVNWSQRPGQILRDNEWFAAIRARNGVPGGMCEFDLPNYHSWLNFPAQERSMHLGTWLTSFGPLEACLLLSLRILRGGNAPVDVLATKGQVQHDIRAKPFQLMRIWISPEHKVVPEISASRHVVWVRLMQQSTEFKSNPAEYDVPLKIALCAL